MFPSPATQCRQQLTIITTFIILENSDSQEFLDFDDLAASAEVHPDELYSLLSDIAYEDAYYGTGAIFNN